jgi:hypothetical protein
MINEIDKLMKDNINGIRFYSFQNPVVFYKKPENLKSHRIIFNTPFKVYNSNNIITNNNENNKEIENIEFNKKYNLYINLDNTTYGIYKLYDSNKKDMGIMRFKKFEELNEFKDIIKKGKYKNVLLSLYYNETFKKWELSEDNITRSIISAN